MLNLPFIFIQLVRRTSGPGLLGFRLRMIAPIAISRASTRREIQSFPFLSVLRCDKARIQRLDSQICFFSRRLKRWKKIVHSQYQARRHTVAFHWRNEFKKLDQQFRRLSSTYICIYKLPLYYISINRTLEQINMIRSVVQVTIFYVQPRYKNLNHVPTLVLVLEYMISTQSRSSRKILIVPSRKIKSLHLTSSTEHFKIKIFP